VVAAGVKVVPAESYVSGVNFTHVFTVIRRAFTVRCVWVGLEFKVISRDFKATGGFKGIERGFRVTGEFKGIWICVGCEFKVIG